jgi:hypothetical protein
MLNLVRNYQRINPVKYVPIDLVEKLRFDPAWAGVIQHLEQGKLGLKIVYPAVKAQPVAEVDHKAVKEVKDIEKMVLSEVSQLRAEVSRLAIKEVNDEVASIKSDVKEIKKKPKIVRDPTKTSIQVSWDTKGRLKVIKGAKSYDELLKERFGM